jgi:hypothetical protein
MLLELHSGNSLKTGSNDLRGINSQAATCWNKGFLQQFQEKSVKGILQEFPRNSGEENRVIQGEEKKSSVSKGRLTGNGKEMVAPT